MGTNLTQGEQTRIIPQTLASLVRFSAQQPVVSFDRNKPLPITREYLNILLHRLDFTASAIVGVGQVIRGWDEGLQGMCLDEKRTLTIPSHLAYGEKANIHSMELCLKGYNRSSRIWFRHSSKLCAHL